MLWLFIVFWRALSQPTPEPTSCSSRTFQRNIVSTVQDKPIFIQTADMDGDADLDLVAASDHDLTLYWFENPTWTSHVISTTWDIKWFDIADFDGTSFVTNIVEKERRKEGRRKKK